jgi:hypothetical protein
VRAAVEGVLASCSLSVYVTRWQVHPRVAAQRRDERVTPPRRSASARRRGYGGVVADGRRNGMYIGLGGFLLLILIF